MHHSESRAAGNQRFIWISVFAVALWLSLVTAGPAFAGAEWQHDTEGNPTSWGDTSDEGHHPPEAPAPEAPCTEEEKPPEGAPPGGPPPEEKPPGHETPPVESPPVETPPVQAPPVQAPPVQAPPVQAPPVQAPPVETPPVETPPAEKPQSPARPRSESPTAPVQEKGSGGGQVLAQEQGSGGVGGQVVPTATEATLPFTGSRTPLLMLFGVGFLGMGVGLRRAVAERG